MRLRCAITLLCINDMRERVYNTILCAHLHKKGNFGCRGLLEGSSLLIIRANGSKDKDVTDWAFQEVVQTILVG